jgi:DNA invertase Pin-like site-specific DNA recombinase
VRLIGYLRVSSDAQVDGYGLASQEQAVSAWAAKHRHDLCRVVTDAGVSGTVDALVRPGLSEALSAIARKEADGLVVARLDRLARALTVQEATLAIVWRTGGEVFTADTGRVLADDPDDPMRTALRQVVGVFAELDRRMVVKRLRDGRAAKSASGRKAVGAYPYGYTGTGKGHQRDSSPVSTEQAVVNKILRARARGQSYRQIAAELTEASHVTRRGAAWSAMSVRAIALREQPRNENGASACLREEQPDQRTKAPSQSPIGGTTHAS